LFRAVHTIKGSAGIFGFDDVVSFTHVAESVMGRLRDKELGLNDELMSLLLDSRDQINDLVRQVIDYPGEALSDTLRERGDGLLAQLNLYLNSEQPEQADSPQATEAESESADEGAMVGSDCWHISLRFGRQVLANGMDPLSFFRYLSTVGDTSSMTTLATELPDLNSMNPEDCYLGFEIDLKTEASKEIIAEVFEFVLDDCQLHILPPRSKIADYTALIDTLPEENMAIGEILVASGALTHEELREALQYQGEHTVIETISDDDHLPVEIVSKPPLGEVLVDKGMTDTRLVDAAVNKQIKV
ncbi:MAG: chemotaxis protein CheA, partial [Gammaproteobacteria bacterium]|nr:chemotaxis protein CheA [Gammaproteobacteria bacterium]